MKKQYVTTGTSTISKNIFRNILRPLDNYTFKPNGGLWSSEFNEYIISEWFDYIISVNPDLQLFKDITKASVFTLKEEAKILKINSYEQIENLSKKYPSYHHILGFYQNLTPEYTIFDFEELSKEYDGIDVNYYSINYFGKLKSFKTWSVNTLLLFNIDCIESYQSIEIKPNNPYDSEELPIIEKRSNKKIIKDSSQIYIYLYNYIKILFNELINNYKNITDYNNFFDIVVIVTNKCIKTIKEEKKKELEELFIELNNEEIPLYKEEQKDIVIRNIMLNYISEYFNDKKEDIKNLAKSPLKEKKLYRI